MPQISIRLEQDLYDKIESLRGEKERTAFIKDLIVSQIESQSNSNESQCDTSDSHRITDESHVIHLNEEIEYLRKKLDESHVIHNQEKMELLRLLNQSQVLQLQQQRQLPDPNSKPWWMIWKR